MISTTGESKFSSQGSREWAIAAERAFSVIMLRTVVGAAGMYAIEHLFDSTYYLEHAKAAYAKELGGKAIKLQAKPEGLIVDRLALHFESQGLTFNKGRVAKRVMKDLATKQAKNLPAATLRL